jgi:hypothetical protein
LASSLSRKFNGFFDRIAANPLLHGIAFQEVRTAGVHRFPYRVYYLPQAESIEIVAVFHTSRDPAIWQRRV